MSTDLEEHLLRFNARFEAMELAQKTFRDEIMRDMRELVTRVSAAQKQKARIPIVEEKCEKIVTSNSIPAHLPDNSDAKRPVALINHSKPPRVIYFHKLPRIKYSFEPIGSSLFFIDAFSYHVHDPGPLILFSSTRKSRVSNFGEFSSLRESAG